MNRDRRLVELRAAVKAIEIGRPKRVAKGAKLSVTSVGKEADVHPSTIHTRYPEIVLLIKAKSGKQSHEVKKQSSIEIKRLKSVIRDLRGKLRAADSTLAKVVSELASMQCENEQLRSIGASANVVRLQRSPG